MYMPEVNELFGFPAPLPIIKSPIEGSAEAVVQLDWRWVVGLSLLALGVVIIIVNQKKKIQRLNEIVFSRDEANSQL